MRILLIPLLLLATPAHADDRTFMVGSYDRIRVEGAYEVRVTTGPSPRAGASGDRRALDYLDVHLDGTTLVIGRGIGDRPPSGTPNPVVTLTVPRLRGVVVNGGGRMTVDAMQGQRVDLALNGAGTLAVGKITADETNVLLIGTGSMTLAGASGRARFNNNGAGAIDATGLGARDVELYSASAGPTRVTATQTAKVNASGVGQVQVEGGAPCTITGPGPVDCAGGTAVR